jgi:hypothetical protein
MFGRWCSSRRLLLPERILSSAGSLSPIGREDGRIQESKFCWILQQLDHAFEQTTGAATVDAAMIET